MQPPRTRKISTLLRGPNLEHLERIAAKEKRTMSNQLSRIVDEWVEWKRQTNPELFRTQEGGAVPSATTA